MSNHVEIRDARRSGSKGAFGPRGRKSRAKTFGTEESANKYASENKIKSYILENLKSTEAKEKKIRIKVI